MTINCFAIDDEQHALDVLGKHILKTPGLTLAGMDTNPLEALDKITSGTVKADITFLDIDMPQLSGMDLAGLLPVNTNIIFTTAFKDYAVSAFEKDAVDYILKPIAYERFLLSIKKVRERLINNEKDASHIFIQFEGKLQRIDLEEVVYVESAQNYIRIHLDNDIKLVYLTLKEIQERLPSTQFVQVHRSYLINLHKVIGVEGGMIHLSEGNTVQIGASFKKSFQRKITPHLIRSKR